MAAPASRGRPLGAGTRRPPRRESEHQHRPPRCRERNAITCSDTTIAISLSSFDLLQRSGRDLLDDRRLGSPRSARQQQQRGSLASARARSPLVLLWPPGQLRPAPLAHVPQTGKRSKIRLGTLARASAAKAGLDVLEHGEVEKIIRPAERRRLRGRRARSSPPADLDVADLDAARARRQKADQRAETTSSCPCRCGPMTARIFFGSARGSAP